MHGKTTLSSASSVGVLMKAKQDVRCGEHRRGWQWQLLRVIQKMARQLELVEEEGRGEAHIFVHSGICLPAYYYL